MEYDKNKHAKAEHYLASHLTVQILIDLKDLSRAAGMVVIIIF